MRATSIYMKERAGRKKVSNIPSDKAKIETPPWRRQPTEEAEYRAYRRGETKKGEPKKRGKYTSRKGTP